MGMYNSELMFGVSTPFFVTHRINEIMPFERMVARQWQPQPQPYAWENWLRNSSPRCGGERSATV